MSLARASLAVLGVSIAAVGVGLVAMPDVAASFPVRNTWVAFAGVLALVQAASGFVGWVNRDRDHRTVEPDAAEQVPAGPTPGEEFDELVGRVLTAENPGAQRTRRERVRWRLQEAALAALERRGHDRAEAIDLLHDGGWTDDDVAAWFFRDDTEDLDASDGIRGALGFADTPRRSFVRGAERVGLEIARLAGVDRDPDGEQDSDGDRDPDGGRTRSGGGDGSGGGTNGGDGRASDSPASADPGDPEGPRGEASTSPAAPGGDR